MHKKLIKRVTGGPITSSNPSYGGTSTSTGGSGNANTGNTGAVSSA